MTRILRNTLGMLLVFAFLSGCDDFSLTDEFLLEPIDTGGSGSSSDLELVLEKTAVEQGESIEVYPSGGTSPYSFGVIEVDLFYPGTLGTFNGQTYTAGNSIGLFNINVTDAEVNTATALLVIQPPPVTNFTITMGSDDGNPDIYLNWTYSADTDYISGFNLYRGVDGGEHSIYQWIGASSSVNYHDVGLDSSSVYTYYVTAEAKTSTGSYESEPSPTKTLSNPN